MASNNLDYTKEDIDKFYKKRWNIEVYHKALKQNASLAKSPTRVRTQKNHIFMAVIAVTKLQLISLKENTNQFYLKTKLYIEAIKGAFKELEYIKKKHNINTFLA